MLDAARDRRGELLLGELLLALAHSTDALQAEAKRGTGHVLFIGQPGAFFRRAYAPPGDTALDHLGGSEDATPGLGTGPSDAQVERGDRRVLSPTISG